MVGPAREALQKIATNDKKELGFTFDGAEPVSINHRPPSHDDDDDDDDDEWFECVTFFFSFFVSFFCFVEQ
jgi:hypothetical protein